MGLNYAPESGKPHCCRLLKRTFTFSAKAPLNLNRLGKWRKCNHQRCRKKKQRLTDASCKQLMGSESWEHKLFLLSGGSQTKIRKKEIPPSYDFCTLAPLMARGELPPPICGVPRQMCTFPFSRRRCLHHHRRCKSRILLRAGKLSAQGPLLMHFLQNPTPPQLPPPPPGREVQAGPKLDPLLFGGGNGARALRKNPAAAAAAADAKVRQSSQLAAHLRTTTTAGGGGGAPRRLLQRGEGCKFERIFAYDFSGCGSG